ncbi:hypothetical protein NSQ59_07515 [Margalitia sp. FSL K6-0131]|uniref:hypothetical protein n=1 Tax=Margalitia sp. FSL K6-0131 TaxID=2954604 RepID=UPI0030F578FA
MPIRSGFFNSVNGDRRYQADFFAMFFGTLIGNGVFPNPSTGLQVLANQNMTVTIKPGKGWINGYFFVNDSDYNLTIENADGVLNRIDRIVLQLNFLNREIVPVVKKGTFASSPVAPTLKRDADAYEIALADIYVGKGVLSISQANITDVRLNKDLCGIVKGLIDQVDTTTIFNQYQAWFANITGSTQTEIDTWKTQQEQDFDTWEEGRKSEFQTWFDSIQSILDGDVAANLASRISNLENDVARHKADYTQHPGEGDTAGSNNAYTLTLNPAPTSYVKNLGVLITVHADSTAAATLNVNNLGAKKLLRSNGNAVTNLKANGVYHFRYNPSADSGNGAFMFVGEGGEYGNVTAKDVRNTKTFGTENGIEQGALDLTNLVASNIKQGVTIDGVVGTLMDSNKSDLALRVLSTFDFSYKGSKLSNIGDDGIVFTCYNNSVGGIYFLQAVCKTETWAASNNMGSQLTCVERSKDSVYFGTQNGRVYKYSIVKNAVGTQSWYYSLPSQNIPDDISVSPDGSLIAVSDRSLATLHILKSDGTLLKDIPLPDYARKVIFDPNDNNIVYSIASGVARKIVISSSRLQWETGTGISYDIFKPKIFNNNLYFVTTNSMGYKLNTSNGAIIESGVSGVGMPAFDKFGNVLMATGPYITYLSNETLRGTQTRLMAISGSEIATKNNYGYVNDGNGVTYFNIYYGLNVGG